MSKNLFHSLIICWSLPLFPEFFPQRCLQSLQNSHFNIQQDSLPLFFCGRHSTITHTHFVSHYGSKLSPRAQTQLHKNRSQRSKQHIAELTQQLHSSHRGPGHHHLSPENCISLLTLPLPVILSKRPECSFKDVSQVMSLLGSKSSGDFTFTNSKTWTWLHLLQVCAQTSP